MDATTALTQPDAELLAHVYQTNGPGIVRWISVLTRDRDAADDVVQEAFLRLARELAQGRRPVNAAGWVAQVARHLAISRGRRASTALRMAPRLEGPSGPGDPADDVVAGERAQAVRRALEVLLPTERTAVVLAAQGVCGPDIARRIGRTPLATRALLCRARRRLRPLLAEADAAR